MRATPRLARLVEGSPLSAATFARVVLGGRGGETLRRWLTRRAIPPGIRAWAESVTTITTDLREDGSARVVIEYAPGTVVKRGRRRAVR